MHSSKGEEKMSASTGPPGAENGRRPKAAKQIGRSSKFISDDNNVASSPDFANGRRRQLRAEDSVRKLCVSSVRDDAAIPGCLRTLERAQREFGHDALAVAISAAEWHLCDLLIWQSYPPQFARAEAWKNIKIAVAWVTHLRRRKGRVQP